MRVTLGDTTTNGTFVNSRGGLRVRVRVRIRVRVRVRVRVRGGVRVRVWVRARVRVRIRVGVRVGVGVRVYRVRVRASTIARCPAASIRSPRVDDDGPLHLQRHPAGGRSAEDSQRLFRFPYSARSTSLPVPVGDRVAHACTHRPRPSHDLHYSCCLPAPPGQSPLGLFSWGEEECSRREPCWRRVSLPRNRRYRWCSHDRHHHNTQHRATWYV